MNKNFLLILDFLKRDLKAQYAGSALGLGWFVLSPLFQIAIYAGIFGVVFKTRPMVGGTEAPYVVFLCSALIPWTIYSNTIIRLSGNFLEHSQYIRKLNIPKWVFIAYVSLSACVQFVMLYVLFLLLSSTFGVRPSISSQILYLAFRVFAFRKLFLIRFVHFNGGICLVILLLCDGLSYPLEVDNDCIVLIVLLIMKIIIVVVIMRRHLFFL